MSDPENYSNREALGELVEVLIEFAALERVAIDAPWREKYYEAMVKLFDLRNAIVSAQIPIKPTRKTR